MFAEDGTGRPGYDHKATSRKSLLGIGALDLTLSKWLYQTNSSFGRRHASVLSRICGSAGPRRQQSMSETFKDSSSSSSSRLRNNSRLLP